MPAAIPQEQEDLEVALLIQGYSYEEILAISPSSTSIPALGTRNRRRYGIDIEAAMVARVDREGIPRVITPPERGWYFSGLFDGEGCFLTWRRKDRSQFVLAAKIGLRADDVAVLETLRSWFGGALGYYKGNPTSNPSVHWCVEHTKILAEVIVPLFETYPLRTKKAAEFVLWKELVIDRYRTSFRGTRSFKWSEKQTARFLEIEALFKNTRSWKCEKP